METFGIILSKETSLYSGRSKTSVVKELLPLWTPVKVLEVKYREGSTWLEVQIFDEAKTKGYILEDKPFQKKWVQFENTSTDFPLLEKVNGEYVDANRMLRRGDNFYVAYTTGVFTNIIYQGKNYILAGQLQGKPVEEWSSKAILLTIVTGICLFYGAFVLAPEIFPPGRYPRILLFLPGLAVAAFAVPAVWGLIYAYEELEKRV